MVTKKKIEDLIKKVYIDADQKYLSRVLIDISQFGPITPDEHNSKQIEFPCASAEEIHRLVDYARKGILAVCVGLVSTVYVPTVVYPGGVSVIVDYWNGSTEKYEPMALEIDFIVPEESEDTEDEETTDDSGTGGNPSAPPINIPTD